MAEQKDVAYYRRLPYTRTVELREDPDGRTYFVARVAEIPPLRIHGATREEALKNLDEIFDDVIESMLESGDEIPEPEPWPGRSIDRERVSWWERVRRRDKDEDVSPTSSEDDPIRGLSLGGWRLDGDSAKETLGAHTP